MNKPLLVVSAFVLGLGCLFIGIAAGIALRLASL